MMMGLIVLACGVQLWTAQPARAQYYQTTGSSSRRQFNSLYYLRY